MVRADPEYHAYIRTVPMYNTFQLHRTLRRGDGAAIPVKTNIQSTMSLDYYEITKRITMYVGCFMAGEYFLLRAIAPRRNLSTAFVFLDSQF